MPKRKQHNHYILFAIATVMFWRGIWGLLDKIPFLSDHFLADILSAIVGLLILWWVSRGFRHLH